MIMPTARRVLDVDSIWGAILLLDFATEAWRVDLTRGMKSPWKCDPQEAQRRAAILPVARPMSDRMQYPQPRVQCDQCRAIPICGRCVECRDRPLFGGAGIRKRSCLLRRCDRHCSPKAGSVIRVCHDASRGAHV